MRLCTSFRGDAMPIRFRCDGCESLVQVRDELAGANVRCQRCDEVLTVPAVGEPPAERAAEPALPSSSRGEAESGPPPAWRSPREELDGEALPRPAGRRRNDDASLGLIIGVAGGAALLIGGAVALLVWLLARDNPRIPVRPGMNFGGPGMPIMPGMPAGGPGMPAGFDNPGAFPGMKPEMKIFRPKDVIPDNERPMFFEKDGPPRLGRPPFGPPM